MDKKILKEDISTTLISLSLSMEDILESMGFLAAAMVYPLEKLLKETLFFRHLRQNSQWKMYKSLQENSTATLENTYLDDLVFSKIALTQGYKIFISSKILKSPETPDYLNFFYQRALPFLKDHAGNLSVENGVVLNTTIPQQKIALNFLKELNLDHQVKLSGKETVNPLLKKEFKPSKLLEIFNKSQSYYFYPNYLRNVIPHIHIGNKQLNWEWVGKNLFEKDHLKLNEISSNEFKECLKQAWYDGKINLEQLVYNHKTITPSSSIYANSEDVKLKIALEIILTASQYHHISFSKEDIIKINKMSENWYLNEFLYKQYLSQSNGLDWLDCGDESFIYNVCDYLLTDSKSLLENDIYIQYKSTVSFLNLNENVRHTEILLNIFKNQVKTPELISIPENSNLHLTM